MMDLSLATLVRFPLHGEWRATSTPAERVPSHGTNFFAQRYAFDFVQMDSTGTWFYPGGAGRLLRHLSTGIPASHFYCWDEPVYSATSGTVTAVGEGWPDRSRVNLPWEILRTSFAPPQIGAGKDYRPLTGNYVIVEGTEGSAVYGHLRAGSVRVAEGDSIAAGDQLGRVGNSGNSTMPHLHFQLMDAPDPLRARGMPCCFGNYERWEEAAGGSGCWVPVERGVPGPMERIRTPAGVAEGDTR